MEDKIKLLHELNVEIYRQYKKGRIKTLDGFMEMVNDRIKVEINNISNKKADV